MEAKIFAGEGVAKISYIGATLTEWTVEGINVLHPFRYIGKKQRGGIPICCPTFGSEPKGFKGILQHGWFRHCKAKLGYEGQSRVVSNVRYKGECKCYPWWLDLSVSHEIISHRNKDTLDTRLELHRVSGGDEMPINVAFHPYFVSHGRRDVYINGKKHVVDISTKARCVKINATDEIIIDTGKFRIKMSLVGFDYDTCLYLWGDAKEYFCIEPVLAPPSSFNTKDGVWLSQEQSIEVSMRLSIAF